MKSPLQQSPDRDASANALTVERSSSDDVVHYRLAGMLTKDTAHVLDPVLSPAGSERTLELECSGLTAIDSAGAATFSVIARHCEASHKQLRFIGLKPDLKSIVELLPHRQFADPSAVKAPGGLEQLGERTLDALSVLAVTVDTAYLLGRALLRAFKGEFPPRGSVALHSVRIGVEALPIVALLSLLLGLVLAFQAADQLKPFGADIYTANLVGVGMFREFGPVLTGVMVAGRSGSAMAAELGTMKVNEEVDALRVLGIDPFRYLVLPRFIAIVLMQPALTLLGSLVGAVGGFVIGTLYLKLPGSAYISQSISALVVNDVVHGLSKSVIFAALTGIIGCHSGLSVRGGADAVGTATTRAVVVSIFMLIVADSVFTTLATVLR